MFLKQKQINNKGVTIIEALVVLFIFSLITVTFYKSWAVAIGAIIDSKKKIGAVALANEVLEQIRNMSYDSIGTIGGDVEGSLPQIQSIIKGGVAYTVETDVDVVNDDFDNVPEDYNPVDFKKVTVKAIWDPGNEAKSASLVSSFVPPGIEDVFTGGILKLKVIDNGGNPLQSVWARVKNDTLNPVLDAYEKTDVNGEIWFYQSAPSLETYEITISPAGRDSYDYFPVKTFARTLTFEPDDVHGSVIGGVINSKTIKTDKVSDIKLHLRDPFDNIVQNENFDFKGGREQGYDAALASERYYLEETNLNSEADGDVSFEDASYGSYFFIYPDDDPDYKFLWVDQSVNIANKFDLPPNVSADIYVRLAKKDSGSLLIMVVDKNDGTPIQDATVEVVSGATNLSSETNQYGYVYFPDSDSGLSDLPDGEYAIEAQKSGDSDSDTVTLSGNISEVTLQL